jgi:nitrilase
VSARPKPAEFRPPRWETVRVAAVQIAPVVLDADATVQKVVSWLGRAASAGAQLAVFAETLIPVYPSNPWAASAASYEGWDEMFMRLWQNSVEVPGPLVDRLVEGCRVHDIECVIGVTEREIDRPGTLFNTLLYMGPDGLRHRHRKLSPTHHEKVIYGSGDGEDLRAVDLPFARVAGLTCYENWMPLARYTLYRQGPQIWVAPTADDSEEWIATMRHIAIESGAFVVSVPNFIPRSAFPDDFPLELPEGDEPFEKGAAAIIEPGNGEVIAGPLRDEEGLVTADCDLAQVLLAKRTFDVVGHYSRQDVFHHLAGFEDPEPAIARYSGTKDDEPGGSDGTH